MGFPPTFSLAGREKMNALYDMVPLYCPTDFAASKCGRGARGEVAKRFQNREYYRFPDLLARNFLLSVSAPSFHLAAKRGESRSAENGNEAKTFRSEKIFLFLYLSLSLWFPCGTLPKPQEDVIYCLIVTPPVFEPRRMSPIFATLSLVSECFVR